MSYRTQLVSYLGESFAKTLWRLQIRRYTKLHSPDGCTRWCTSIKSFPGILRCGEGKIFLLHALFNNVHKKAQSDMNYSLWRQKQHGYIMNQINIWLEILEIPVNSIASWEQKEKYRDKFIGTDRFILKYTHNIWFIFSLYILII